MSWCSDAHDYRNHSPNSSLIDSILTSIKAYNPKTTDLITEEDQITNTNESDFSDTDQCKKISMPTVLKRLHMEEETLKKIIFHTTPINGQMPSATQIPKSKFRKIHIPTNSHHFSKETGKMHHINPTYK